VLNLRFSLLLERLLFYLLLERNALARLDYTVSMNGFIVNGYLVVMGQEAIVVCLKAVMLSFPEVIQGGY